MTTRFQPGAFISDGTDVYEVIKTLESENAGTGPPTIKHLIIEKYNTGHRQGILLSTAEAKFSLKSPA